MRLDDAFTAVSRLAFDTAPISYFVEAHPRYDALVTAIFERVARGEVEGVTSVISLTEVLVHPVQQGNQALSDSYTDLLLHSEHFQTVPIEAAAARRAAELRAKYQLRTPDALQLASALTAGCDAFLTNDVKLLRVTELRVVVLDQLVL
jgi:predicted nucleic acid-binding protein